MIPKFPQGPFGGDEPDQSYALIPPFPEQSPSATVEDETSFGITPNAGTSNQYSRGDHTHGSPTAPTIPSASATVSNETTFGVTPDEGVAATFSRGDHTHGSPANPIIVPGGSWTPVLEFGGTTTGITYATQIGTYIRIGNFVWATYLIALTSKGSATGNASVSGLPIAMANADLAGGYSIYQVNLAAQVDILPTGANGGSGTEFALLQAGASANLTDLSFNNNSQFHGHILYEVA